MASPSDPRSVTATLSTTVADTVTLEQAWPAIEVTNHDLAAWLYFRQDGVTAVADADGVTPVAPGTSKVARASMTSVSGAQHVISVVGNANKYSVEGVN